MNNIKKLDLVLKIIVTSNNTFIDNVEIANEIERTKTKMLYKELIEIIHKLEKDENIISTIIADINTYCSSFEGRLLYQNGGYELLFKKNKRQQRFTTFSNITIIANIIIMSILTYFIYKTTEKANDNKEEITKYQNIVKNLNKNIDSLNFIIQNNKTKPILNNFKK